MSHTFRIYNNPKIKKAQRHYWDSPEIFDEKGATIPINTNIIGFPYTKYRQICMGRCQMCRDPNKEPKLVRKRNKENFRFQLKEELS